ncbi:MAG: hypothetical protein XE10_0495 [Methanoculleus marisnigri]|uniref:Uncharacterized protein n=1 Tax=Methanoculleus marisnigri TaxID=2198 RepID=A0A117MGU3_9EURY|nr:MAG: hypothetical protein XE10_0495 [Methanoculleus marisnigri]
MKSEVRTGQVSGRRQGGRGTPLPKCISIFHGNEVPRVYVNIPVRVHNQWRPYRVRADIRMSIRGGASVSRCCSTQKGSRVPVRLTGVPGRLAANRIRSGSPLLPANGGVFSDHGR